MPNSAFIADISRHVWDTKYRRRDGQVIRDQTIEDTWQRVARALASAENKDQEIWQQRFYQVLDGFKFLPAGRIMAGAGTQHRVTLFNCFVMGLIEDSMDGIFNALKEGALTMQQGGGVGYDFSTLRPRGSFAKTTGSIASGPVSFMRIWNAMCATLLSTGARRGAMMATLRCDHPDIEEFIQAKQVSGELNHFNLSVQISDEFLNAVHHDYDWSLVFPEADLDPDERLGAETVLRSWPNKPEPTPCCVMKKLKAKALWDRIMRSTYDHAEPGVLFIDRINQMNNLWYREKISATNPCGEIPLPPYGACDLGSINLTQFVREPFTPQATLDIQGISAIVPVAVRMMDNIIDISRFPLPQQAETERGNRRIGLGITGLANTLMMLGLHYNEPKAQELSAEIMKTICHTAYRTSINLAQEKGPFPGFQRDQYMESRFIKTLPQALQDDIAKHGLRNSHVTAIAPTGTISLLANNISSGIEPVFDFDYSRRVLELDGNYKEYNVMDYAAWYWRKIKGPESLPTYFVSARGLAPRAHLEMQAALQPFIDNSISKTINIPADYPYESFREVYELAYEKGLKGCTTFRPNPITGAVLQSGKGEEAPHCCNLEREAD